MYKVHEFAELSGLTVKTLHHYDRLGLLKPRRTETGYRIYAESDLERLQQIVALKYLGLSLQQIKVVLQRAPLELPDALRLQRQVLEEKQRHLARALSAIVAAEKSIRPGEPPDVPMLKRLIETITLQEEADVLRKYWSDEEWARCEMAVAQIKAGPAVKSGAMEEWKNLNRDLAAAAAAGEDPAGEKAQALGARYMDLMKRDAHRFSDLVHLFGEPGFRASSERAVADKQNWPAGIASRIQQTGFQQTVPFILKVMAARPKGAVDFEELASALLTRN